MTDGWEEAAGYLGQRSDARRSYGSIVTGDAAGLASLILAATSLFALGAGETISSSALVSGGEFHHRVLAVAPGIQALIAVIALWLARSALRQEAEPVAATRARAALLVGVVSLVINLTAMGFALS